MKKEDIRMLTKDNIIKFLSIDVNEFCVEDQCELVAAKFTTETYCDCCLQIPIKTT